MRTGVSKLQRTTIGALVVLDVHAKDVVHNLWKANVTDVGAFEWISQLRYFWEEVIPESGQNDILIKCVQTKFPYGYEYLGNSFRLVITPLTDLCCQGCLFGRGVGVKVRVSHVTSCNPNFGRSVLAFIDADFCNPPNFCNEPIPSSRKFQGKIN